MTLNNVKLFPEKRPVTTGASAPVYALMQVSQRKYSVIRRRTVIQSDLYGIQYSVWEPVDNERLSERQATLKLVELKKAGEGV